MSNGFPNFTHSAKRGEQGVSLVSRITSDLFGWLFRRNHQEHDFGIDAQIEVVTDTGAVTGQMLALQIKCGKSFLKETNQWGYVYRGELKHFNYLSNYPIPVLIVICDPESQECFWVHFQADQTQTTGTNWKITVPFENKLSASKAALLALLPPSQDNLAALQEYWAMNELLSKSDYIAFMLDQEEVNSKDTSRPRAFFDQLRATREVAHRCQGKIEFGICGYDDDPRELFEIDEVRRYMAMVEAALPELLFFVRTDQPTHTLKLFAACLANGSWEGERLADEVAGRISIDFNKVEEFLQRQWPGLNELTEWLGMSIDENKRITYAVYRCLGFNVTKDEDGP